MRNGTDERPTDVVLRDVGKVVRAGNVVVYEEVLGGVFGLVAVPEEEFEKVEQAEEVLSPDGTLYRTKDLVLCIMY